MAKERSAELLYVAHDAECSTSEGPAGVGPSASVAGPSSRSRPRASVPRRAVPRAASLPRPRSRLLRAAALLLRTARAWRRRRAPLAPARRSDRAVLRGRRGRLRRRGAQLHRLLEPVDDLRLKLAARRDGGEMSPPSRARRPHPDLVVGDARKERAVRVQVRLQPLSRQRAPARVYLQDARDLDALVGVAVRGDDGVAHHAYGRAASRAISELARPPLQSRTVHRTLADRAEELVGGEHSAEAERLAPRGAAQQGGGVAQQGGGGGRREAAVVRRGRQRVCGSRRQGVSHRSRRFSAFSSASSRSRPRRYGSGASRSAPAPRPRSSADRNSSAVSASASSCAWTVQLRLMSFSHTLAARALDLNTGTRSRNGTPSVASTRCGMGRPETVQSLFAGSLSVSSTLTARSTASTYLPSPTASSASST